MRTPRGKADVENPTSARSARSTPREHIVAGSAPHSHLLVAINALTSACRDGLQPLQSTFLLVEGWSEADIGMVMFCMLMAVVSCQALAGDIVDKTKRKVEWLSVACVLVGLCCVAMVIFPSFPAVLLTRILQGMGCAMIPPAISGITLGIVGPAFFEQQVPLNEVGNRAGYAGIAIVAGLLSYFVSVQLTFHVVLATAILAVILLCQLPAGSINDNRARGATVTDDPIEMTVLGGDLTPPSSKATSYIDLLSEPRLLLFCFIVYTFHVANGGMLPLLGQRLALGGGRDGIPLAILTILIGKAVMTMVALYINRNVTKFGRKPIFMMAFLAIPLRAVLIVACRGAKFPLLLTQVLDGLGDGTYGVMHQVVCQDLTQGTGRFNVVLGLITTCHMLGGATSNLLGEMMAHHYGYDACFLFLGAVSLVPLATFSLFFPETKFPTRPLDSERQVLNRATSSSASPRPHDVRPPPGTMPNIDDTSPLPSRRLVTPKPDA